MSEWIYVCANDELEEEDVRRFDHGEQTFAIYKSPEGDVFATDGHCTHEAVHLAEGLVMDHTIECPKHGGTFDYRSGEALAPPVCINLTRFNVKIEGGDIYLEIR